jgi:hypothetical protein
MLVMKAFKLRRFGIRATQTGTLETHLLLSFPLQASTRLTLKIQNSSIHLRVYGRIQFRIYYHLRQKLDFKGKIGLEINILELAATNSLTSRRLSIGRSIYLIK